jgi:molybdate transport system ATP-binding protein
LSASSGEILDVHLVHRVHSALVLDVAFQLGPTIGVVFGPSGAGKTSLLRLIAGLTKPDDGRVHLSGQTLFDAAQRINCPLRRRQIGMIFQDDCLFPHLDVAANIRFGLKGWPREQSSARLADVAALCGVEHLLTRDPGTLSGGERQRVGLARSLAPRPRLLLCDEPVSALDLANRHALLEHLRAVQRALAIPMLYVTHSPAEAIAVGTQLFLLEQGRIVVQGPPLDVLSAAGKTPAESIRWEGVRNLFTARVIDHSPAQGATHLQLDDGPELIVPFVPRSQGMRLSVEIRADDILLAREPLGGLSARNQIPGTVERIITHGADVEALVRTQGLTWIVSLVAPAAEQLELKPGSSVHVIVKARSCRVIDNQDSEPAS